jgi:hypothetical protein
MAESGMPLREIARRLGFPAGTVLARSSRERWNISAIHGTGRKPETSKAQLAVTNQTLQAGRDYFGDASALSRANLAKSCVTASEHFAGMNGPQLAEHHQPWATSVRNSERVFGWDQAEQEKERMAKLHLQILQMDPKYFFFAAQSSFQSDGDEQAYWDNPQQYFAALPPHEQMRLNQAYIEQDDKSGEE